MYDDVVCFLLPCKLIMIFMMTDWKHIRNIYVIIVLLEPALIHSKVNI